MVFQRIVRPSFDVYIYVCIQVRCSGHTPSVSDFIVVVGFFWCVFFIILKCTAKVKYY